MKGARARAASAVTAVLSRGLTLDEALHLCIGSLEDRDRALCREIAFGVCRRYFELEGMLAQLLERPLKAKDVDLRAFARGALFHLQIANAP